jgi:hypothetical protein
VPADVLAQGHELAVGREEAGGVEATGRVEHALTTAQLLRQRGQHRGLHPRAVRKRGVIVRERLHGRGAAHPAGRARHERALGSAPRAVADADVDLVGLDDVVRHSHARLALAGLSADAHAQHVRE